jgi:serine/threonine protein kinase
VKVLDFGLAKITRPEWQSVSSDISTASRTETGVVMGTAPYMSPEQALGQEVDHRSDVFSLGVLGYEMTTGRRPFTGASATEIIDCILHAQPEPIVRYNEHAPAELERIVNRLLEKERERRYQSAGELLQDLRKLKEKLESGAAVTVAVSLRRERRLRALRRLLAISTLAALVAGLIYLLLFRTSPTTSPNIRSVAVLPLENLSGDSSQDYFAERRAMNETRRISWRCRTKSRGLSPRRSRSSWPRKKGHASPEFGQLIPKPRTPTSRAATTQVSETKRG